MTCGIAVQDDVEIVTKLWVAVVLGKEQRKCRQTAEAQWFNLTYYTAFGVCATAL